MPSISEEAVALTFATTVVISLATAFVVYLLVNYHHRFLQTFSSSSANVLTKAQQENQAKLERYCQNIHEKHSVAKSKLGYMTNCENMFVKLEDETRLQTIAGALVLEDQISVEAVTKVLQNAISSHPRLKQRVVKVSALFYAFEDYEQFTLSDHLTVIRLPDNSTQQHLQVEIERLYEEPLNKKKPLWHCYLFTNYENGRSALSIKLHHCVGDGMAANLLLASSAVDENGVQFSTMMKEAFSSAMNQTKKEPHTATTTVYHKSADHAVSTHPHHPHHPHHHHAHPKHEVAADTSSHKHTEAKKHKSHHEQASNLSLRIVHGFLNLYALALPHSKILSSLTFWLVAILPLKSLWARLYMLYRHSPLRSLYGIYLSLRRLIVDLVWLLIETKVVLNKPATLAKRISWTCNLSLDEVKRVKNAFGVTVNDVLVSALTGALRRQMVKRNEKVIPDNVFCPIPVTMRKTIKDVELLQNNVAGVWHFLPTGIVDPVERLLEVHTRLNERKRNPIYLAFTIGNMAFWGMSPRAIARAVVNKYWAKALAIITNVSGPQTALFLEDTKISEIHIFGLQSCEGGMSISIITYNGKVSVSVVADTPPEVDEKNCKDVRNYLCDTTVLDEFRLEFDEYIRLANHQMKKIVC